MITKETELHCLEVHSAKIKNKIMNKVFRRCRVNRAGGWQIHVIICYFATIIYQIWTLFVIWVKSLFVRAKKLKSENKLKQHIEIIHALTNFSFERCDFNSSRKDSLNGMLMRNIATQFCRHCDRRKVKITCWSIVYCISSVKVQHEFSFAVVHF